METKENGLFHMAFQRKIYLLLPPLKSRDSLLPSTLSSPWTVLKNEAASLVIGNVVTDLA